MPLLRIKRLLLVCILSLSVHSALAVDYAGHKLVQIDVRSPTDLKQIHALGGEPMSCHPHPGLTAVRIPPEAMPALAASGLDYKILSDDIGPATKRHLHRGFRTGPFDDYMTFAEIQTFLYDLQAARPDLCSVSTIGFSLQNRPVMMLHITGPGGGGNKPGVFYHGLQHCREWITGPAILYLANHLVTQYDADPCIQDLVDRTDIYLAPCVNPDGYVYTWNSDRLWRKNRRLNYDGSYGVDLNRNWGVGWSGPGASGNPSDPTYYGTAPFSEPETQVLRSFILNHPSVRAYMDYHSYSQLILWPYGYANIEPPAPDDATFWTLGLEMQRLIQDVHGEYYEAGPIYSTIYQASGGSVDWVYGDQGRFGFTIELRPDSPFPGFELPPDEIIPTCEENLPAILRLTEWASSDLTVTLPDGPPQYLTAGTDTPMTLKIEPSVSTLAPGTAKMYYRYHPDAPFTETSMTDLGGNNYQAVLPATNCTAAPEYYFTAESAAGQTLALPCGAPANTYTAIVRSHTAVFYSNTFSRNPGWSTAGSWAFGPPTGQSAAYGGPDPSSGHTGSTVYGYNLNGDYENNLPQRHLTSTAIDCTGRAGVTLSFWRWLGVEQPSYDHAYVWVSNDGSNWTMIWQNTAEVADTAWTYQEFDISAVADNQPTVYLRWTMGTTDGSWTYCGWNIDDVQLTSAGCDATLGDYNGDTVIDAADFAAFPPCVRGPADDVAPGCGVFDFDADAHIDLRDFHAFQEVAPQ